LSVLYFSNTVPTVAVLRPAGVLHALLACGETRPLVAKVISGWNQHPLIAALTAHQASPTLSAIKHGTGSS